MKKKEYVSSKAGSTESRVSGLAVSRTRCVALVERHWGLRRGCSGSASRPVLVRMAAYCNQALDLITVARLRPVRSKGRAELPDSDARRKRQMLSTGLSRTDPSVRCGGASEQGSGGDAIQTKPVCFEAQPVKRPGARHLVVKRAVLLEFRFPLQPRGEFPRGPWFQRREQKIGAGARRGETRRLSPPSNGSATREDVMTRGSLSRWGMPVHC